MLDQAIHGILQQTYKNWELIIIDDGSTDNTKNVVKNYAIKDLLLLMVIYLI